MSKYKLVILSLIGLLGFGIFSNAQTLEKECQKDGNTLFLCHFNSLDEIKRLGGEFGNEVKCVPGKFGNGLLCEKKGDFIAFPTANNINLTQGTIEMWVKPTIGLKDIKFPEEPHPWLFHLFTGKDEESFYIYYNAGNGTIAMALSRLNEGKQVSAYPQAVVMNWKMGEWHHLAFTWGNGTFIYVDGKLAATQKFDGGIEKVPDKFYLGSTAWLSNPARMVIDEVRILNKQIEFSQPAVW
ncbi:MAG: LamG domain-containing protein [Candidatus Omnitrophota bacterium]